MSNLNFDEESHTYTLTTEDGEDIKLTSVTQLLTKHGLAPDYSNVQSEVLNAKAERGKIVHKELEEYIKTGFCGFTGEIDAFIEKAQELNIKPLKSEFMVHDDEIAGTVDVAGTINGESFIGDFKTTATLHKEAVAWQLSLYAYLMNTDFRKYLCIHFPDEKTCKVVEIQPIPREEIERLLECERNCQLYKKQTLELDAETTNKLVAVQKALISLDEQKKEIEAQEKSLKEFLVKKFEETGLNFVENEFFKIKYLAPTTKEIIDSARLKTEMPDIAKQFTKQSQVKAQVRITLKKVK